MRPGQAAPDEPDAEAVVAVATVASMRPGQAAPDERSTPATPIPAQYASMRPGQAAPDESATAVPPPGSMPLRFNEAGASSPG